MRYYERIGLIPPPGRAVGGHRSYQPEHGSPLAFISPAGELGFALDDVRGLQVLAEPGRQFVR